MPHSTVLVGSMLCPFFTNVGGCQSCSRLTCAAVHTGEISGAVEGRARDDNPKEAVSVETGETVSVENPLDLAKLDDTHVVLLVHRNMDAINDHFLPLDLLLLEISMDMMLEASVVATTQPPSAEIDCVSLVGRRHVTPETLGFLGSFLFDMSLWEPLPVELAAVTPGMLLRRVLSAQDYRRSTRLVLQPSQWTRRPSPVCLRPRRGTLPRCALSARAWQWGHRL